VLGRSTTERVRHTTPPVRGVLCACRAEAREIRQSEGRASAFNREFAWVCGRFSSGRSRRDCHGRTAQCDVSGEAGRRRGCRGAHCGSDGSELRADPDRRSGSDRIVRRRHARADRGEDWDLRSVGTYVFTTEDTEVESCRFSGLVLRVLRVLRGLGGDRHEGAGIGETDLRQVQDRAAAWGRACDLFEPEAQAAAGVMLVVARCGETMINDATNNDGPRTKAKTKD
jgi:hypothetical protein